MRLDILLNELPFVKPLRKRVLLNSNNFYCSVRGTHRRHYAWHSFSGSFDFIVDWSATPMELQHRLGICPFRWADDHLDCDCDSVAAWRDLIFLYVAYYKLFK